MRLSRFVKSALVVVATGTLFPWAAAADPRSTTQAAAAAEPGKESAPKLAPKLKDAKADDILAAVKAAKGKVVLVNCWATWCMPCRNEMPDLLKLRSELRTKGFELVLVSADFDDAAAAAQTFLGSKGVD